MKEKVDPGTQANSHDLTKFERLFPHILDDLGNPNRGTLKPTNKAWINHEGKPQPFLVQLFLDVKHTAEPVYYLTRLYVFKDTTRSLTLLSDAACDKIGILEIKEPKKLPPEKNDLLEKTQNNISFTTLM